MKRIISILFLLAFYYSPAQTIIRGAVKDSRGGVLPHATISLFQVHVAAVKKVARSDSAGLYHFEKTEAGRYFIRVTFVGTKEVVTPVFSVEPGKPVLVADIFMTNDTALLKAVTVTVQTTPIQAKDGRLIYNIDKSLTAGGTTAFDQVRKTPGITIDAEDNLALKGSSAVTIMIDGKLTYLGGQQLTAYLKSLPAESLQRIEVMATPPVQYDATGNAGIINIVTKKGNRQGYALNIRAGIGSGRYMQSTDGLVGNIRTKTFNLFGSYTYNYNHTRLERTSYRTISNNSKVVNYDRHTVDPAVANNNSFKVGADWYMNRNTTIGAVYNGMHNRWTRTGNGPTYLRNASGHIDSLAFNKNYTDEPARSAAYNLNFLTQFDTAGKQLSADADYAIYCNQSDGYLDNGIYGLDGHLLQPYQSLHFQQPNKVIIRSIQCDLVLPNGKRTWKAGAKYAFVTTNNNFKFDSLLNGSYVYSRTLSNHFVYDEKVAAAYISFASALMKDLSIDAGLRIEHTASTGDLRNTGTVNKRNYINWFPYISFNKKLLQNNNLTVAFSRRINRPQYANLNPSRYFFDKYSYREGNPFLQPELSWNGSISYTFKQIYIATLTYSRTEHVIVGFATQDSITGVFRLADQNFFYKAAADLLLVATFRPLPAWSVQTTADLIYTGNKYYDGRNYFNPRRVSVDVQVTQTFSLPKGFKAELAAFYTSPSLHGIYIYRRYFQMDAGIRKSLFKKKLDAVLTCKDIFWTNRYWAYSIYGPTSIRYDHRPDSRRINLALTYRIGGKLSAGRDRKLEEQDRL